MNSRWLTRLVHLGWRGLQLAAAGELLLVGYVFFFCMVSSVDVLGWEIYRPGDLSIPTLLALLVVALSVRPWRWGERGALVLVLGLFLLLFCFFFRPHTGSDGAQYYANLRSLWLDGDLNFYDDAVRHPRQFNDGYIGTLHPRGYTYNGFSVGPAFCWSPFFGAAHAWCTLANLDAKQFIANGYDRPYLLWVCMASALYGFAGMALLYRLLRQWTAPGVAGWTVALVAFASPLLLYLYYEGTYSHAIAFLTGTLVVAQWWRRYARKREPEDLPGWRDTLVLGLCCGLAMLVRWQNGLLLLFPLMDCLHELYAVRYVSRQRVQYLARWLALYLGFSLLLVLAVLPQLAVWRVQAGEWLTVPQGGTYLQYWTNPKISKMLTSRLHGLFSWHPVLLLACLCLPFLWHRHRALLVRSVLVLAGQIYINSVVHDWWAGGSFGQRRFCAVLVLFAVPLALGLQRLVEWGQQRRLGDVARRAVVVLSAALLLNNVFLLTQFLYGPIEPMGKLVPAEYFYSWIGTHPETNANAFNALRDTVIYQPYINSLAYGVLFGDARLAAGPLLELLVLVGGCLLLWSPALARALPGMRCVMQRGLGLVVVLLLVFTAVIGYAGMCARPLEVLNLHPKVLFGNVRLLTVHRHHRYIGGFMNETLAPGGQLDVTLDRPVQPRSVIVVSYVKHRTALPPGTPVARLVLRDVHGATWSQTLRYNTQTARPDERADWPWRPPATAQLEPARSWRPSRYALFNAHSWYTEWTLPRPLQVAALQLTSLLDEGKVQLDGLAFRPGEATAVNPVAEVARRSHPLDFQRYCNAAYDHNPFSPYNDYDMAHFYFSGEPLYHGPVRLVVYPPYDATGRWNTLTTCFHHGDTYTLPLAQPTAVQALHIAFAAGMIRTREPEPLVDIVFVHASGERQVRRLRANEKIFDYLEGYRPAGTVLEGGATTFMYDGRTSVLQIDNDRPDDPVTAVEIVDANGSGPAGISLFALTLVEPAGDDWP